METTDESLKKNKKELLKQCMQILVKILEYVVQFSYCISGRTLKGNFGEYFPLKSMEVLMKWNACQDFYRCVL